jgi:hypothetical protein
MAMNLLLLLPLALPFFCLALLSLIALLGVVALAGVIRVLGTIKSALGLAERGASDHPWHSMVGEAHPLDFVEGQIKGCLTTDVGPDSERRESLKLTLRPAEFNPAVS